MLDGSNMQRRQQQQQQQQQDGIPQRAEVNHTLLTALLGADGQRAFIGAYGYYAPKAGAAASTHGGSKDAVGGKPIAGGAVDMDPGAYALYNPHFGLSSVGLTRQMALDHYERVGQRSKTPAICARIPVVISYSIMGGLCNMAISIINAWTIAVALGADVLLANVHKRGSFAHSGGYAEVPFGSLFSLPATQQLLAELGIRAATEPPRTIGSKRPLLKAKFLFVPMYTAKNGSFIVNTTLLPGFSLDELLPLIMQEVVRAATYEHSARAHRGEVVRCDDPPAVHLHIHHTYDIIRAAFLSLAQHLARGLRFSQVVEERAALITGAMAAKGYVPYNGLHLRLEGDFKALGSQRFGNKSGMLHAYVDAAKRLGWDDPPSDAHPTVQHTLGIADANAASPRARPLPVFVASGLFTYAEGRQEFHEAVKELSPYGSVFVHKEAFEHHLNASMGGTLPALDSEQAAAVDLLLLVQARQFVGATGTTFSWFAAQKRVMQGRSARDAVMAGHYPDRAEQRESVKKAKGTFTPACLVVSCAD